MDKVLRHVVTGNLQTQTFIFTGTPFQWKRYTTKTLVYHSYLICSNYHYLILGLNYLRKDFKEYKNYPHWFITRVFNYVNKTFNQQQGVIVTNETTTAEESNSKKNK